MRTPVESPNFSIEVPGEAGRGKVQNPAICQTSGKAGKKKGER